MKIIAWNINGIASILGSGDLAKMVNEEDPDIFCLGEIKVGRDFDANIETLNTQIGTGKYFGYWNPCKTRAGYSGTATYTKMAPKKVTFGMAVDGTEYDNEGRVITCEFETFILMHVYTPNAGSGLKRLEYRTKIWDPMFSKYVRGFQESTEKTVVVCGDLNVCHREMDIKNPKTNLKTAGYTVVERNSFDVFLSQTRMVDSYRELHPDEIKYSFWTYKFNARARNAGWRLDYFLISEEAMGNVTKSDILVDHLGSDHAPVMLELVTDFRPVKI